MSQVAKAPRLFLYSVTLPIVWLAFGIVFSYIFPELKLGLMGFVIVMLLVLLPICWHFTKRFKRHFSTSEKVRLVIYFTLWTFICESLVLFANLSVEGQSAVSDVEVLEILGAALFLDSILVYLSVQFTAKGFIDYFMGMRQVVNAEQSW